LNNCGLSANSVTAIVLERLMPTEPWTKRFRASLFNGMDVSTET